MSLAIVSTSINREPTVYKQWAEVGTLVVAGDLNTPTELGPYIESLGGVYLSPRAQEAYSFSMAIGWRNIQRRNTAIMYAYEHGFGHVLTVDDDNGPATTATEFAKGHLSALLNARPVPMFASPTGHLNTGVFVHPPFHQRGVPYGIQTHIAVPVEPDGERPTVVVSQAQVLGDPDCDAVERMVNAPEIHAVLTDAIIQPGTYASFNSQATMWTQAWAPVMAVLPGIGRYDDILAAYIFHRMAREYSVALHVGTPCVRQIRNPHNLVNDLRAELWGMNWIFTIVDELNRTHITRDMPIHIAYGEIIVGLSNVLPPRTIEFAKRWIAHWKDLL